MESENQEALFAKLRVLGIVELSTYVLILLSLIFGGREIDGVIVAYLFGAFTLVPSAISFVAAPKRQSIEEVVKARNLQTALFVAVCIAVLPSMVMLFWGAPGVFFASVAGIFFYIIGNAIVKSLTGVTAPAVQPSSAQPGAVESPLASAATGKFCDKCGSKLDSNGKCPSCA